DRLYIHSFPTRRSSDLGWGPDYMDPYTFLNLWLTDGQNNKMGYSNEEYDKLIQETTDELAQDPEARYQNFLEAEKILAETAAVRSEEHTSELQSRFDLV